MNAWDAAGNIHKLYSSGTLDPRVVLADIRTLMMESRRDALARFTTAHVPQRASGVA